ncbi:MAG: hypothetical protein ACTHU0_21365 [Kofleriaceae bacterium]
MAAGLLVVVAVVRVLARAVTSGKLFRRRRQRMRVKSPTPLVEGELATVAGVVRAVGPLLTAPLSGREVVLYEASAMLPHDGELVQREISSFELETAEGIVLIDDAAAELAFEPRSLIPRQIDREIAFVVASGRPRSATRTAEFAETAIAPGDRIVVQGLVVVEHDHASVEERGYREGSPARLRLVGRPGGPLKIGEARGVARPRGAA